MLFAEKIVIVIVSKLHRIIIVSFIESQDRLYVQ